MPLSFCTTGVCCLGMVLYVLLFLTRSLLKKQDINQTFRSESLTCWKGNISMSFNKTFVESAVQYRLGRLCSWDGWNVPIMFRYFAASCMVLCAADFFVQRHVRGSRKCRGYSMGFARVLDCLGMFRQVELLSRPHPDICHINFSLFSK